MGFGVICVEVCQLVSYKVIMVNGCVVNIVFYQVSLNDVVSICEKVKKQFCVKVVLELVEQCEKLIWLEVDVGKMEGMFKCKLECFDLFADINEYLIVEFYFK